MVESYTLWYVVACVWLGFFFFSSRRRHTRFDCDWSSDVCSSDLYRPGPRIAAVTARVIRVRPVVSHHPQPPGRHGHVEGLVGWPLTGVQIIPLVQIGRASCRERV